MLADTTRPLSDRLLDAFDEWTGRYIGAMSREATTVARNTPTCSYPPSPSSPVLLDAALPESPNTARRSAGDHADLDQHVLLNETQVSTRAAFLERLVITVDLIID
ncbi:hypothetical protein [Nocardia sp. AB354]|uniref:hypothetical protein n=1 Tax=Nocardia sp. AB354 TaxID=3413283 RepID=UPI003C203EFE